MFGCMYMPINNFFYAALQSRFSSTYICMYRQMHKIHKILHILECLSQIFFIIQLIKVSNFSKPL